MATMNGDRELNVKPPLGRSILTVFLVTGLLLLIPLVAMQFNTEVNWDETDFIVMGILLSTIGLLYVAGSRMVKTTGQRIAVGVVLFLVFFFTWAELAVGVFGTPWAGS
ncbi:hypothetical protein [Pseudoduganella sp. GCM10020061]|uniref:hypothetical protein n=1 Tax=Pseudoduganella sp. GCM10020061 TaxID=3317345 RepID=UPI0036250556